MPHLQLSDDVMSVLVPSLRQSGVMSSDRVCSLSHPLVSLHGLMVHRHFALRLELALNLCLNHIPVDVNLQDASIHHRG